MPSGPSTIFKKNHRLNRILQPFLRRPITKSLFFDIDGTLVSFITHSVPPSAMQALQQARQQGCKLFIASGRPIQWLVTPPLRPLLPLMDGLITTNGAMALVDNRVCFTFPMQNEDVEMLLEDSRKKGYPCIVVGQEHIAFQGDMTVARDLFEPILQLGRVELITYDEQMLARDPILQVSPFFTVEQERSIMPRLSQSICNRWHPAFADVTATGATKGNALRALVGHLSLDPAQTIAFGDGGNDVSMFHAAAVGVAMGCAAEDVKAQATLVAPTAEEDGIAWALRRLVFGEG